MSPPAPLRIDPAVGFAVAAPSVAIVDGGLRLVWDERPTRVVVETAASIEEERTRSRRAAGSLAGGGRSVRSRSGRRTADGRASTRHDRGRGGGQVGGGVGGRVAGTARLDGALDRRDVAALDELGRDGDGDTAAAARLVAVLLRRSDHADTSDSGGTGDLGSAADPDHLADPSPAVLDLVARRVGARFLLDLAPGVVGRSPTTSTSLLLLRAELIDERSGAGSALHVLEASDDRTTTVALRRVTLLASLGRHREVVEATEGLTNVDDGTTLLLVARGAAAAHLGRHDDAAWAFGEALRLPRRSAAIRRRALLARALAHDGRGHRGRALADLRRARDVGDPVDGLDRAIRSLQQRR